jgi:hypothetical protein
VTQACEHGVYGEGMCRDCRGEVLGEEDRAQFRGDSAPMDAEMLHAEHVELDGSFDVKCDAENNPIEDVTAGRINVQVSLGVRPRGEGQKLDHGKLPFDLLPWRVVAEVVQVLEHGRLKYGAWNWVHVPEARTRYFAAAHRHLAAWWAGEHADGGPGGSGLSHLAHALCCIIFLRALEIGDVGPRPDPEQPAEQSER